MYNCERAKEQKKTQATLLCMLYALLHKYVSISSFDLTKTPKNNVYILTCHNG